MRKVGTTALVLLFLALATSLFAARTDTNVALAQSTNAIFSVQDGNWSDPATWHLGRPPQAGEHVVISPWTVVTYDVFSDEVLGQILVDGVLTISRTVDTRLKVSDHIVVGSISGGSLSHLVTGGFLDMGTTEDPIPAGVRSELIFVLPPSYQFVGGPFTHIDDIGLWAISGRWEVHGAPLNHTWAKLAADADAGSNVVIARHDLTDWTVGGSLVVTQTSIPYNPTSQCTLEDSCAYRWENEVRTITDLQLLPNGRTQITLDQPLNFDHQGTGRTRGEVGLLTRNVLIRSEILGVSDQTLDQSITQRRFAHTMFMGTTQGKIQYAEFKYMGHLETLARYPVHIHMTGTAGNGVEIRGNSIWRSGNRGYQVHNTQGVVVEDNVAFDTIMSPYYIERTGLPGETIPKDDATKSPHGNYVIHNLGVQATKGTDKGQGQQNDDAIFWLDQLDQVVLGNVGVAAGANGGTGGIPQGSETPRPEHSGMWIGEQAGSTGEIRTPVILKNELHSAASDGLGMWITKGPGLDFVDIKVWRNGQDGVKWGYYRNPHRLFQLQAIENRDDGFGSDTDNRSGTRYLVDAEFIGNFIGIKNGPDVVRPIYPDFPYTYIRPVFDGNTHAAMTLYSRDCSDEPLEETQPLSEKRSCHGNYVQVLEPVFRCGTTIDFSDGSEKHSVVNGGNKNTQWRIKDAQGLPPAFPNDFLLMRPDQIDPVNQTAFSQEFVSTDAWVAPELDNEALVVPIDSLPDSISPPVWGHSGSNSGGGVIDPVNYYTFEKAVDLPPEVSVNVTLDGKIATVNADATDDQGVARVEFYVDDVLVATETTAPYQTTVDLTDHPRKYAYIYAIAFDNHLLTYSNASQGALDTLPDDEEPVFQFLTRDQRAYSKVIELGPESYTAAASVPPGTAVLPLATLRDTSLEADLSSVDLGAPQDDSTFTMIDYPEHGSLCGAAPFMTYTPAPGYTGADSFTYQVTDLGGNTSIVTATINVFGDTLLYFSVKEPATLGTEGLVTSNEDIISFDGDTYSRFFDGSDVGIGALQIDAISIIGGNEILMSFSQDGTVPGIAEVVEDTDIVKFTATSLGETTSGSFELYFHGRGVGLGGNNDDINGIELLEDGRILVTTLSDFTADGLTGQGQDIIAFTPTQLGSATAGAWDMYLDGSDVSLDSNKERLTALSQHPSGDIYLSTESNFDVGTVSGWRDDAFVFQPQNLGDSTAGTYLPDLFFKGADHGLSGNHLMAIDLPTAGTSKVFVSANNLSLAEGGASTSYDVALLTQPASDVDIIVTPDGQASVSPNVLTFTAGDWNAPQTVTVTAIDDAVVEGDHNGGISHSSASADQQFVGVFIPGVALDISDNDSAPPVAQDQSIVLDQDSSIALVLTATDVDSPPEDLTFSVATPPASGALSGTAPDLTYTPNPGYSGPDSFTFVANDGSGDSAPATVSITVNPIFQLPTAQDQTVSATEDTPVGLTLTAVDPDTPQQELIFSVVTPPANGVLSGTAPDLTYTPNPDYNGPDSFTFVANDGSNDSNAATVSVDVSPVDDPPVATNHGAGTAEDTAVGLTLSASDVDTAQQDLIFSVVTPPSNGGLSGTAPDLVYTPNPDYNGPDSFTFMANDGSNDSNVATVSLDVSPVNDAPAASNQGASTTEDTAVGLTLTASDVDNPPQDLTFSVVTPPVNGALSGTVPDLTYTPNPDYNGPDSFTFQVNDGAAVSNIATVSLNVTSVNDPPVADARSVTLDQDASTSIVLTASDADTPLENLVFNLLTSPASGSLTGTLPNLTYTPDPGYTGPDSFTFQVNDGAAVSNIATVSLTVTSATQFYFSVKDDTTLSGGLVVTDEDILAFDGVLFNKYFDGSDVGIAHREIDAFTMISATEILMSFSQDGSVPGIPLVEDTDIVRFTAASLGEDTAGVFDLYFHGRDVGLASNDDDVNSIELLPDGRILVSTKGNFTALGDEGGLNGTAHDIIALTPTSLGADTAGSWELYFDGSDVSLTTNNETISAVAVDGSGAVYLSTLGGFDVGNVAGDREDVFTFQPTALGTPTAGIYQSPLYFNGTGAHGLSGNNIYGFDLP